MVNPASGSSIDRNEEQDSGLRRSSVERNKEGDGFVRLRLEETKEGDTVGGARLTIEIGADFPIGITGRLPLALPQAIERRIDVQHGEGQVWRLPPEQDGHGDGQRGTLQATVSQYLLPDRIDPRTRDRRDVLGAGR